MNELNQQHNQMVYFPYLNMKDDFISIGPLKIWNFNKLKNVEIANQEMREYITKLLEANVSGGRPIQNIGVVTRKGRPFDIATKADQVHVYNARLLLFLGGVAKSNIRQSENAGFWMLTAENFSVVYQNFILNHKWTGYSSGKIINVNAGGHEVGKILYEKPQHVLLNGFRVDQALLRVLKKLKRKDPRLFKLILKATEALMNGYFNSHDLSDSARILEQVRAFEILFELPEKQQRKVFKEKIRDLCTPAAAEMFSYTFELSAGKLISARAPMNVIWAEKIYSLRNHIIHGNDVSQNEYMFYQQRHQDLSLWFYLVGLKKIINKTLNEEVFFDEITWRKQRFEYEEKNYTRIILKELRRFREKAEKV